MMKQNRITLKRLLCAVLSCLLITSAAAGCSEDEIEAKTVTLRTVSMLGGSGAGDVYNSVLGKFSKEHSGIYVRDTSAQRSESYKLDLMLESTYTGTGAPDIVYYYSKDLSGEKLRQYFVPLSEIRQSYPEFAKDLNKKALDCVQADDGEIYCIPCFGGFAGMAVNTKPFTEVGINELPTTKDELLAAARVLSAAGYILFADPADDCAGIIDQIFLSLGGEKTRSAAIETVSGSDAEWTAALSIYDELYAAGAFPPAAYSDDLAPFVPAPTIHDALLGADRDKKTHLDALELFNSGKAAMIYIDQDNVGSLSTQTGIDLKTLKFGNENWSYGTFSEGFFITRTAFASAARRDLAIELVDSMTKAEMCANFAKAQNSVSAARDFDMLADSPIIKMASNYIIRADRIYTNMNTDAPTWRAALKHLGARSLEAVDAAQTVALITGREKDVVKLAADNFAAKQAQEEADRLIAEQLHMPPQ